MCRFVTHHPIPDDDYMVLENVMDFAGEVLLGPLMQSSAAAVLNTWDDQNVLLTLQLVKTSFIMPLITMFAAVAREALPAETIPVSALRAEEGTSWSALTVVPAASTVLAFTLRKPQIAAAADRLQSRFWSLLHAYGRCCGNSVSNMAYSLVSDIVAVKEFAPCLAFVLHYPVSYSAAVSALHFCSDVLSLQRVPSAVAGGGAVGSGPKASFIDALGSSLLQPCTTLLSVPRLPFTYREKALVVACFEVIRNVLGCTVTGASSRGDMRSDASLEASVLLSTRARDIPDRVDPALARRVLESWEAANQSALSLRHQSADSRGDDSAVSEHAFAWIARLAFDQQLTIRVHLFETLSYVSMLSTVSGRALTFPLLSTARLLLRYLSPLQAEPVVAARHRDASDDHSKAAALISVEMSRVQDAALLLLHALVVYCHTSAPDSSGLISLISTRHLSDDKATDAALHDEKHLDVTMSSVTPSNTPTGSAAVNAGATSEDPPIDTLVNALPWLLSASSTSDVTCARACNIITTLLRTVDSAPLVDWILERLHQMGLLKLVLTRVTTVSVQPDDAPKAQVCLFARESQSGSNTEGVDMFANMLIRTASCLAPVLHSSTYAATAGAWPQSSAIRADHHTGQSLGEGSAIRSTGHATAPLQCALRRCA